MSTTAFAVSDSVGARETKIYVEAPKEWGTIKNMYCLIGNVYGGEELPFLELRTDSTKCKLVDANNRLYSFDTSVYCQKNDKNGYAIEDNADYYIVFSAINTKGDVFNTSKSTMGSPCLGDTAKIKYEKIGSGDSLKINNIIEWKNNSDKYGRQAVITPTGDIAGSYFPVYQPAEEVISKWLGTYGSNKYIITTENVKNICKVADVEPQSVYDTYAKMYAEKLADIENNSRIAPLERIAVLVGLENTTYVVAGSKEICLQEWNGNPTEVPYNVMTKVGDVYKLLFYYVEPDVELEFKVAEYNYDGNPNWYGCADGESVRFKVTSQSHVTVTYNPINRRIEVLGDAVEILSNLESDELGDVNNDGTISILDATEIMKYSADLIDETQIIFKYADVNGDGTVNVMDATAIQKILAGI